MHQQNERCPPNNHSYAQNSQNFTFITIYGYHHSCLIAWPTTSQMRVFTENTMHDFGALKEANEFYCPRSNAHECTSILLKLPMFMMRIFQKSNDFANFFSWFILIDLHFVYCVWGRNSCLVVDGLTQRIKSSFEI